MKNQNELASSRTLLLFFLIIKTVESWRSAAAVRAYGMGFLQSTRTIMLSHSSHEQWGNGESWVCSPTFPSIGQILPTRMFTSQKRHLLIELVLTGEGPHRRWKCLNHAECWTREDRAPVTCTPECNRDFTRAPDPVEVACAHLVY